MARRHIYSLLALILRSCLITTALIAGTQSSKAQTGPGSCAVDTVVGNIGGGLTCLTSPVISALSFVAVANNGINDQSAVLGSAGTYWSSSGPAIVHRMNRLAVGSAATAGTGCPGSPNNDWMTTIVGGTCDTAQITVTATLGIGAIQAGSRTSDEVAALGTPSGGSAGGYFFGYNNDATSGNIAVGSNGVGFADAGTHGVALGAQQDVNSKAASCVPTPGSPFCSVGTPVTIANLLTSGAFTFATQNPTSAMQIGLGRGGGPAFNTGIVFQSGSVATGVGPSGTTVGIAMPTLYEIQWYSGTTLEGVIETDSGNVLQLAATTINFAPTTLEINGTAGVSCSGSPTASFASIDGIVTHC